MALALLLAAGSGERLGATVPKAFALLAGKPLLQWSLDVLAACEAIDRIVLALPAAAVEAADATRSPHGSTPGVTLPANAISVQGGAVRSASVVNALAVAGPGDPVLVHDAARPLLTVELVERTLSTLNAGVDAAIAATPVTDTIKRASVFAPAVGSPPGLRVRGQSELGGGGVLCPIVTETLERSGLWSVQTPQVFRRGALERALAVPEDVLAQATDDAWLLERTDARVAIVPSSTQNLKVTTAFDLKLAELLVSSR
jgi:2-C-methyl-D-erythritol 4-phosphate cytidylyltransferase